MAIGDDLSARLRAIPAPVQGALIMTAAAFCFSVMNGFVRLATEEVAALAELAGAAGGIYATHMRDETEHVVESLAESFEIAKRGGVKLIISHHKVAGRANHGRTQETLPLILEAMKGHDVGLDVYPYVAASSILSAARAARAERVLIAWSSGEPEAAGRDPKTIRLMVCNVPADRDSIRALEIAGADRVTVSLPRDTGEGMLEKLEQLADSVLT